MNSRIVFVVLVCVIVASVGTVPAFSAPAALSNNTGVNPTSSSGDIWKITVTTDKQSYVTGDVITITGIGKPNQTITQYLVGIHAPVTSTIKIPIAIRVIDSAGSLIQVQALDLDDSGKYSMTIPTDGALWKNPGLYTITAMQENPEHQAQTQFWFNYNGGPIPEQQPSHNILPTTTSGNGQGVTSIPPKQTAVNEIDIATGAGGSANAACVSTNDCFYPNPLIVLLGATVTWKNTDNVMHAICSGHANDPQCGPVFEDDSLKPGETFQFTFQNSGTYNYYCSIHPWMTGQVIVKGNVSNVPHTASGAGASSTNPSPSNSVNPPSVPLMSNGTQNNGTGTIPPAVHKIPNWVKSVFGYYAQGNLSDDDLIKALQFLIQQGIIKIS